LHTGFRLVPKSVTFNDLERHSDRYLRYSTEFGSFEANDGQSGEDRPALSAWDKNVVIV